MSEALWKPGDVIVLRYMETPVSARIVHSYMGDPALIAGIPFLANGRMLTTAARPYRVVEDTDARTVLHQPAGTTFPRWVIDEGRYLEQPQVMHASTLRLFYPGRPYDVTLFFETAGEVPWFYEQLFDGEGMTPGWRERRRLSGGDSAAPRMGRDGLFRGWYINLQSPPRRTSYGIDICDLALDIVVRPDRSWYWKDEDELAMGLAAGACTPEFAAHLRRAGEDVVRLIEAGASPFDAELTSWRDPTDWTINEIPDGWQTAPAVVEQWWEWPEP